MRNFLLAIMLIFVLANCKEEDDLSNPKIRISKIADNEAMNNPIIFEYDTQNLLVKIIKDGVTCAIAYNDSKLPVKLTFSTSTYSNERNIVWNSQGFKLQASGNVYNEFIVSNDRIISVNDLNYGYKYDIAYNGDSIKYNYSTNKFKCCLSKVSHPLKNINIALLAMLNDGMEYWDMDIWSVNEYQKIYCLNYEYQTSVGEGYYGFDESSISYEVNESNLPIKATIHLKGSTTTTGKGGGSYDYYEYLYYEYETY